MIMRRSFLFLLAGALALMAAGGALASDQFAATFKVNKMTREPATSSGFHTLITWSDPGEPGGVPKAIQEIVFKFHRGSEFDTGALAACEATDDEIKEQGAAACPADSQVGSGHTDALLGTTALHTDVTLFNAPDQIIVLVFLHGTDTVLTEFRDEVSGRTVTVRPVLPDGVSLTRLNLHFDEHSKGSGEHQVAYLTSPPTCPAGGEWKTRARFTYADASTERFDSPAPCRSSAAR